MADGMRNEYRPDSVTPPGEILEEILQTRGMSQSELAERTGRPRKTISEIIGGKASITPETAIQLERVLGIRASFWGNLEANYREFLARESERERLSAWSEWAGKFPVAQMAKRGWIKRVAGDSVGQVQELLSFFGVASPEQWEQRNEALQAAFRQSSAFEVDSAAVAAWLRAGERSAQRIECAPYDRARFLEALLEARRLTNLASDLFVPELTRKCAAAGVAVVFVPEMPKSRVSGAARWLSPKKALVQLSLRYKTNDHLWFTFFHEAAHILLHAKKLVFLEGGSPSSEEMEQEANRFAADWLIPPRQFKAIRTAAQAASGRISKRLVLSWAQSVGIAPGILVGRLQHDELLPRRNLNGLKVKLEWVA